MYAGPSRRYLNCANAASDVASHRDTVEVVRRGVGSGVVIMPAMYAARGKCCHGPWRYHQSMASITSYLTKSGQRYMVRYRKPDGRSTDKRGFLTKRDATAWAADLSISKRTGAFVPESARRQLLEPLITRHVAETAALAPSTAAGYATVSQTWVMAQWGTWSVGRVTQAEVRAWVQDMSDRGAGPATIAKAYGMISAVLRDAVAAHLIAANPATGVSLPRPIKRQHHYLTHAEVWELANAIDQRSRTLVIFQAYSGLRFGETAALRVGDIDLRRRRVRVARSVTEVGGALVEGPTKTHKARSVPLPIFLADLVCEIVAGRLPSEPVFTSARGGQVRLTTWRRRVFYPAIEAVNAVRKEAAEKVEKEPVPFPAITPHDLRHTAASLAIQAGAHVKAIQRMLGHASAAMTLDIYGALFDSDLDDVATALDRAATAWTKTKRG